MKDSVKMSKKGMDMVGKYIAMETTTLDFGRMTKRMAGEKNIMPRMVKLKKVTGLMVNYNKIEN